MKTANGFRIDRRLDSVPWLDGNGRNIKRCFQMNHFIVRKRLQLDIMNVFWLSLLGQILTAASFNISIKSSLLNEFKSKRIFLNRESTVTGELRLRVTVRPDQPFFYENIKGEFYEGIEYRVIQVIAKKLNMIVSYQAWPGDHQILSSK